MGCDNLPLGSGRSASGVKSNVPWHEKVHWKAQDYFDDPQVVALCQAIEANDLKGMKRQIDEGADVNAKGHGNMTPLLWAYFDDKPDRLLLLLEYGADPNVIFTSNFGVNGSTFSGTSVTHMAAATRFDKYFDYVFGHGGDPNLVSNTPLGTNYTPIFEVIRGPSSDKKRKIGRLIDLGANLDVVNGADATPSEAAASRCRFDIVLQLLEAGANPRVYSSPRSNQQLVHVMLMMQRRLASLPAEQQQYYQKVLDWLQNHGVSVEQARADLKRWKTPVTAKEYAKLMASEVAARKAKEAREQDNLSSGDAPTRD
jgi:ankyrin repeat protein